MVYCLDAWGFHESVNIQAFKVLEKLRGSDASSRCCRRLKTERRSWGWFW
ncbi:hypothetical protein F2Q70_00034891 [Brassica cretica]|uniref:Uncharacterized protein n=1 Tax=Brassica cretica TaxID=69181 RepID=A0A8S9JYD9_BRACR|nr:hypothetical protein F2Q68_00029826 [Brassica cretica]KAF2587084.1 hypothetical protein F2Q70_00034891 [Brassica cretica]